MELPAERVLPSVCSHDCPDTCALRVTVREGRVVAVGGDPGHPVTQGHICFKVQQYAHRLYGSDRVLHPLRRVGAKGQCQFERISWDEALETICARLRAVAEEWGAEAVLPYSYAGTMGVINNASMDRRFFHRLGASRLGRTICSAAGNAGLRYTLGAAVGPDPLAAAAARYVIIWGCNVPVTNLHQSASIRAARRQGARVVVIDAHRNHAAALADEFVPILPGTDHALALGMMHVIVAEGRHDRDYVARHTHGFEAFRERLQEYPPERVAALTGVPAETVVRLAREYATRQPAFIRMGNGPQHHTNGGMMIRTIACLPALVGAWRWPAGGLLKSNSGLFPWNRPRLERPDLLGNRRARTINMIHLGRALTELDAPPVKALFVYNSNPAAVAPEQERVLRGLAREDLFTVVHEVSLTDTARYADIVLPACTSFEYEDLYGSYWHTHVQYAAPVIPPVGESMRNTELFRRLAERIGFTEEALQESDEELMRQALSGGHPHFAGMTLERLRAERSVRLSIPEPWAPYADGSFATPSGKCEFYCEDLRREGLDPLPSFEAPEESVRSGSERRRRFPIMLISPPARHFLNSTFANLPPTLEREREPSIEMHPADAAARGIASGDWVRVWNDRGECLLRARVAETVLPGVAVAVGVWWPGLSARGTNVNATTSAEAADMGGGAVFFSNLVEVARELPASATERA